MGSIMKNDFFKVVVLPSSEPVTAEDVKEFSRIDTSAEDTLLESFIVAVRQATELYLGRSLMTQTLDYYFDYWPVNNIVELPRPPLISVTSIVAINESGTEETISSSNYYVVSEAIPGRVVLKAGLSGLVITPRASAGYKVKLKAGYGYDALNVPTAIKQGMMQWVAYIYETRNFQPEPPPEALGFLSFFRVLKV